jgi:hypothetical protein
MLKFIHIDINFQVIHLIHNCIELFYKLPHDRGVKIYQPSKNICSTYL